MASADQSRVASSAAKEGRDAAIRDTSPPMLGLALREPDARANVGGSDRVLKCPDRGVGVSVPTYDRFMDPVLRVLAEHPDGQRAASVHEAAADRLHLSEDDRREILPSGQQPVYKNRAGWAHDRLKRAGLSTSPRRGFWRLTPEGLAFARSHAGPLGDRELAALIEAGAHVRLRDARGGTPELLVGDAPERPAALEASPDDRLEGALIELRASAAAELLERIGENSPAFFEALVLDLLLAMGYGAGRRDLRHVGRSGDGGIDGIISLDRLGLEKVYVQAKRWQGSVGREAVQAFYGALAGRRAQKGVFLTTSTFTPQALEFARAIEHVVLVDGATLADLMMEYGVGVSHREIKIPKVDRDYFEDAE